MSEISSNVSNELKNSSSLLGALESVRNLNAFLSLFSGVIVALLAAGFLTFIGMRLALEGHGSAAGLLSLIAVLVCFVILATTYSACGIHLHRQFAGQAPQSFVSTLLVALTTLPKFIVVAVLIGVISLLTMLALLLLYFICRLPGLGPLLFFVSLPAGTLVVMIMAFALFFLTPLAGPAIWAGNSSLQVLATLWQILKKRLLSVVIQSLILGFLVWVVSGLVFLGFGAGIGTNIGLSSLAIGSFHGSMMDSLMGIFSPYGGSEGGYMMAGAAGIGLLVVALGTIPLLITTGGGCLIFRGVAQDLGIEEVEAALRKQLDTTQKKLREAGNALTPPTPPAAPAACPSCNAPLEAGAVFCGNCGKRLGA